jgi:hypothetical protein
MKIMCIYFLPLLHIEIDEFYNNIFLMIFTQILLKFCDIVSLWYNLT